MGLHSTMDHPANWGSKVSQFVHSYVLQWFVGRKKQTKCIQEPNNNSLDTVTVTKCAQEQNNNSLDTVTLTKCSQEPNDDSLDTIAAIKSSQEPNNSPLSTVTVDYDTDMVACNGIGDLVGRNGIANGICHAYGRLFMII